VVYADLPPNCDLASPAFSNRWTQFKSKYGRNYKDAKDEKDRSDRFKRRLCEIDYLNNKEPGGCQFGINKYSDWLDIEWQALQGGRLETSSVQKRDVETTYDQPVPTSVTSKNWCTDGYCTPIKNQKSCGSCWAFSTTEVYESAVAIKNGWTGANVPIYSPQYILDCNNVTSVRQGSSSCWKGQGCNGGPISLGYIKEQGHFTLADYPYSSDLMQHNSAKPLSVAPDLGLTAWVNAQTASEDQFAANVAAYGPLAALVYADQPWQSYSSGILTAAQCGTGAVNHAVVIVGFAANYWIIRNSWGTTWGESGFIRIERGTGACQITGYAYLVPTSFIPAGSPPPTTPPPATPPPTTPPPLPVTPPPASTCKATGCMAWPVPLGSLTLTGCSNIPVYGVPVATYGVCITSFSQTSSGSTFYYKNCPSSCGSNPPSYTASSAYGSNAKVTVTGVKDTQSILAINSETGANFTPSNSPLPVYVGAGVVALVALVVIVVIVVLVKRRANQEEIV